jgi:hypothetical protein
VCRILVHVQGISSRADPKPNHAVIVTIIEEPKFDIKRAGDGIEVSPSR